LLHRQEGRDLRGDQKNIRKKIQPRRTMQEEASSLSKSEVGMYRLGEDKKKRKIQERHFDKKGNTSQGKGK